MPAATAASSTMTTRSKITSPSKACARSTAGSKASSASREPSSVTMIFSNIASASRRSGWRWGNDWHCGSRSYPRPTHTSRLHPQQALDSHPNLSVTAPKVLDVIGPAEELHRTKISLIQWTNDTISVWEEGLHLDCERRLSA